MENLAFKRFGSLTVMNEFQKEKRQNGQTIRWRCKCDCGNELYINADSLKRRTVKYCPLCRQVGVRNEKLYHIYHGMLQRCYNQRNPSYSKYGGRGKIVFRNGDDIKVVPCDLCLVDQMDEITDEEFLSILNVGELPA